MITKALVCLLAMQSLLAAAEFEFKLAKPALTSGGVFDKEGRLVRVLWSMKDLPVGKQHGDWDGKDEFGNDAPPGDYKYKVIVNGATYRNVGAIGNSGKPPSADGHTPAN